MLHRDLRAKIHKSGYCEFRAGCIAEEKKKTLILNDPRLNVLSGFVFYFILRDMKSMHCID